MLRVLGRHVAALVVLLGLLGAGCTIQTVGSPKGGLELHAEFDTVRNLVVGHSVKIADVGVGTVMAVELIPGTYRATVTMSIEEGRRIPEGTRALIRKTSLLGEHYVALEFPPEFDPATATYLTDGAVITDTMAFNDLEEVVARADAFIAALSVGDIDRLLDATIEGLGGRGEQLGQMIVQLGQVTEAYNAQRDELVRLLEGFGEFTGDLAEGSDVVNTALVELTAATTTLAGQREQVLTTVEDALTAIQTVEDVLLDEEGLTTIDAALDSSAEILGVLADNTDSLDRLLVSIGEFAPVARRAIHNDVLLVYALLEPANVVPSPLADVLPDLPAIPGIPLPGPDDLPDLPLPVPAGESPLGGLEDLLGPALGGLLGGRR